MKKILIVHTRYQNVGGEDIAVENEVNFLSKYFEVDTLYFQNDNEINFKQIKYFIKNSNLNSVKELEKKITNFHPDLVYIHNTWFKGSLGIFKLLESKNIRTVLKLHNFRYLCTRSIFSYKHLNGELICKACGFTKRRFRIFNKYFKESFLKSILVIIYGKKYFKILKSSQLSLIVLTEFHKNILQKLDGFKSNIFVQPNPLNFELNVISEEKNNSILYAGRISVEKGVDKLIESFINVNIENLNLIILGDGPQRNELKVKYEKFEKIRFLQSLPNNKTLELIGKSIAVVTATKLYEGQPTFLCEASTLGVPSIFPKTGGIEEFFPINYKLSFKQFDYKSLEEKFKLLLNLSELKTIGNDNRGFLRSYLDEKKLIDSFKMIING